MATPFKSPGTSHSSGSEAETGKIATLPGGFRASEAESSTRSEEVRRLSLEAVYQIESLCLMALAHMKRDGSDEFAVYATLVRISGLNSALMSAVYDSETFDLVGHHQVLLGTDRGIGKQPYL